MTHTYTQGLIIDGTPYNIPLVKVDRTFDFLEKYANRSEDGDMQLETIGGYQNYTVEIGVIDDVNTYKALYDHITDPENRFHTVKLPDSSGVFSFYGYFSSIKDTIEKIYSNKVTYSGLSWKMTEKKPTRT